MPATDGMGWRAALEGESCTTACSREDATCQVSRMNAINSEAKFAVVNAAVSNAFDCDSFPSSESGRTPVYDINNGKRCYWQSATGSTCDTLGENGFRRLCCCTFAGDDSSIMCPVEAANCDAAGLVWNGKGACALPAAQSGDVSSNLGKDPLPKPFLPSFEQVSA